MVTCSDEMLTHQVVSTFDHVDTSDLQWCERVWFGGFDIAGERMIGAGLGKYTNRNVIDAYAAVVEGTTQHNVRASRELRPDIDSLTVGPLTYTITPQFDRVGFVLAENEYGFSFEIEAEGVVPIVEQRPQMFRRSRGRVVNHMIRFFQYGRARGWVMIDGKKHDIKPELWVTQRDRSWGIRRSAAEYLPAPEGANFGLQPPKREKVTYYWHATTMQFDDFALQYEGASSVEGQRLGTHHGEKWFPYGDDRKRRRVVNVEHDWDMVPGTTTNEIRGGQDIVTLEDGTEMELTYRVLTRFSRKTGGYFGYRGWASGAWMGAQWVDGETLNLEDPAVQEELKGGVWDYAVECRYGNQVGYGNLEPFIEGIG